MSEPTDELTAEEHGAWARVELWRWQYGMLPTTNDMRPLNVPLGLRGMARAIRTCDPDNFPSPFNVAEVLDYAANVIELTCGDDPANVLDKADDDE